jgi:hypothetical protein
MLTVSKKGGKNFTPTVEPVFNLYSFFSLPRLSLFMAVENPKQSHSLTVYLTCSKSNFTLYLTRETFGTTVTARLSFLSKSSATIIRLTRFAPSSFFYGSHVAQNLAKRPIGCFASLLCFKNV